MKKILTIPVILAVVLMMVLAASCSPEQTQEPTISPTLEGVAQALSSSETPVESVPTLTMEAFAPTTEIQQTMVTATPQTLSPNGPWALIAGDGGVWAVNPDGTALAQLSAEILHKPAAGDLQQAVSPAGSMAAFVTISDPYMHEMTLHVVHFPDMRETLTLPLTSQITEPVPDMEAGSDFDPYLAAGDFAWSPDGQMLAISGLMEGETSDLYLYSLSDGSVTRMTDGPTEAYQISWSPDGRYILHFGAYGFGTGAGSPVDSAWLVDTLYGTVQWLYEPQANGEYVDGWLSSGEFVVHSWSAACGNFNFRSYDIYRGTESSIYEGAVRGSALDEQSGALLIVLQPTDICPVGYTDLQGIYILWPGNPYLTPLSQEVAYFPYWHSPAQRFIIPGLGMTVTPQGQTAVFPEGMTGYYAWSTPGGEWWAWSGTWHSAEPAGLWVGSAGQTPQRIYDPYVHAVQWRPDGGVLLFLDGRGLYAAQAPDFVPLKVEEMNAREFALVAGREGQP